ncbi:MAG: FAD-dependent oxidoreductase [Caldilineales bacterium]|nr:FAD-dependent oxidoreductase [Caldilineales bacterium]
MSKAIIVGDGPAGLSAALFLAKNGIETTVFGNDKTAMHFAHLRNYLGIPDITGTEFQRVARDQVMSFGAEIVDDMVADIERSDDGFTVITQAGNSYAAKYLLIAEGKGRKQARALGLTETEDGIEVDHDFRTSVPGLYVVGRGTRTGRSQAIISAGHGATAAIDIISTEKGQDFRDFNEVSSD